MGPIVVIYVYQTYVTTTAAIRRSALLRHEDDLAGDALAEEVKGLLIAGERQLVGDDRADVQALAQKRRGLVPGFPELAPRDAVDAQPAEDDRVVEVDGNRARRQAEQGDAPAVGRHLEGLVDRRLGAAHLQHHVHARAAGFAADLRHHVARAEDPRRAVKRAERDRQQPDRPAAEDRDRARGDLLDECGEDGVAHRFLDRGYLRGQALAGPGIAFGQAHVLGEGAVRVHAANPEVGADVLAAGPALIAGPVDEVSFGRDSGAQWDGAGSGPVGHHSAGHLVAEDAGQVLAQTLLGPRIPAVDVKVRATQGDGLQADQHFPGPRARDGDLAQLGAGLGPSLYEGPHGLG